MAGFVILLNGAIEYLFSKQIPTYKYKYESSPCILLNYIVKYFNFDCQVYQVNEKSDDTGRIFSNGFVSNF